MTLPACLPATSPLLVGEVALLAGDQADVAVEVAELDVGADERVDALRPGRDDDAMGEDPADLAEDEIAGLDFALLDAPHERRDEAEEPLLRLVDVPVARIVARIEPLDQAGVGVDRQHEHGAVDADALDAGAVMPGRTHPGHRLGNDGRALFGHAHMPAPVTAGGVNGWPRKWSKLPCAVQSAIVSRQPRTALKASPLAGAFGSGKASVIAPEALR